MSASMSTSAALNSALDFVQLEKTGSSATAHYSFSLNFDVQVIQEKESITVMVSHLGKTSRYETSEILFTDGSEDTYTIEEFCKKEGCKVSKVFSHHIQSIAFAFKEKKLVPVISTAKMLRVQARE